MRTLVATIAAGLLALSIPLLAPSAGAATVAGLYEVEVAIAGEDPDSRNQAIGEALALVLVKLTGRDPAPGLAELSAQAPRFVQQFRYRRAVGEDGGAQTRLWVRFDKGGLDRALRDRGLPLWGSSRPAILLWLAVDAGRGPALIGGDGELGLAVRDAAMARGLPLQWPLLDLEDQARLTAADLWSDYAPAVAQASTRYAQPLVLTGRLRRVAADHWEGRWTLYEGEEQRALNSSGATAVATARAALASVAELLAARYAPAGSGDGPQPVWVRVDGVSGVQHYARVLRLIGDRELVERVAVRQAQDNGLLLEVWARGGRDALAQTLDLARELVRQPDPLPPPPPPVVPPLPMAPVEQPPVGESGGQAPGADAAGEPAAPVTDGVPIVQPPPPVAAPQPVTVDLVYRLSN